jgi:hypothetical protein
VKPLREELRAEEQSELFTRRIPDQEAVDGADSSPCIRVPHCRREPVLDLAVDGDGQVQKDTYPLPSAGIVLPMKRAVEEVSEGQHQALLTARLEHAGHPCAAGETRAKDIPGVAAPLNGLLKQSLLIEMVVPR